MISKIITGRSFRGLLSYAMREGEQDSGARLVAGNILGQDVDTLARQMMQVRLQKPELMKPVTHLVVPSLVTPRCRSHSW